MDTVKELQAKKMSLLEDMQRIGDKITKEIGTQTSRGYDCDVPDSEGNEVNDFEAGSCDKENENDNSVPVSDLSEQEKAMKLNEERLYLFQTPTRLVLRIGTWEIEVTWRPTIRTDLIYK